LEEPIVQMMTHVIPDVHSDPTDSDDDDAIT